MRTIQRIMAQIINAHRRQPSLHVPGILKSRIPESRAKEYPNIAKSRAVLLRIAGFREGMLDMTQKWEKHVVALKSMMMLRPPPEGEAGECLSGRIWDHVVGTFNPGDEIRHVVDANGIEKCSKTGCIGQRMPSLERKWRFGILPTSKPSTVVFVAYCAIVNPRL
jgi:hypothetical protein